MSERDWISVEDRLPTKEEVAAADRPFLVVHRWREDLIDYSKHRGELTAWYHPYESEKCYGKWTTDDENGYDYEVPVSHWMPLPDPPSADKGNGDGARDE